MTAGSDNVAWLTQDAYNRLQEELEHLMGPARSEIAKRIEAARAEGDLSENGGYQAAKEEQGKQEARIHQLQQLLQRAKVGETPSDDGVVEPGMIVEIKFAGDDEPEQFLLGSRELAALDDSVELEVYSPQSPLGAAINGQPAGATVTYQAPNGRDVTVEIISAKPYG
ncbi:transcription elongation factor GreA [Actinobacteria bacterium YIM 96077]|uniref:Transcription elongation factor GreA n=1 Tax=Phytoactinopolyspora halophila TaxID=1981511 RepID=A0A329QHW7_9ACTN|nr:transcription elongation factor GreA [Phytoactinopolyspora halophila]AYY14363.1 transcription elongation factor GreA [Actinobacteria bacterium YIM 96077]RAW11914.1 transcription elongation factor GreA [Phytoactinopolyspora halophila]